MSASPVASLGGVDPFSTTASAIQAPPATRETARAAAARLRNLEEELRSRSMNISAATGSAARQSAARRVTQQQQEQESFAGDNDVRTLGGARVTRSGRDNGSNSQAARPAPEEDTQDVRDMLRLVLQRMERIEQQQQMSDREAPPTPANIANNSNNISQYMDSFLANNGASNGGGNGGGANNTNNSISIYRDYDPTTNQQRIPFDVTALAKSQQLAENSLFTEADTVDMAGLMANIRKIQEFVVMGDTMTANKAKVKILPAFDGLYFVTDWLTVTQQQLYNAVSKDTSKGKSLSLMIDRIFAKARTQFITKEPDQNILKGICAEILQKYAQCSPQAVTASLLHCRVPKGTPFADALSSYQVWLQVSISIDPSISSNHMRETAVRQWFRDQYNTLFHLVAEENTQGLTATQLLEKTEYNRHAVSMMATAPTFHILQLMKGAVIPSAAGGDTPGSGDSKAHTKMVSQYEGALRACGVVLNALDMSVKKSGVICVNCKQPGHIMQVCNQPYNHSHHMEARARGAYHCNDADHFERIKMSFARSNSIVLKALANAQGTSSNPGNNPGNNNSNNNSGWNNAGQRRNNGGGYRGKP